MRLFYLLLFGITGLALIVTAITGAKWYFSRAGKKGGKGARLFTGLAGALLLAYGIAYFVGWI